MPNGMASGPIGVTGYKTMQTTDGSRVTSIHTVPVEQFIHNLDQNAECLCGPDTDYVDAALGPVVQVIHFALDRQYYRGRDWGPDGPDPVNSSL